MAGHLRVAPVNVGNGVSWRPCALRGKRVSGSPRSTVSGVSWPQGFHDGGTRTARGCPRGAVRSLGGGLCAVSGLSQAGRVAMLCASWYPRQSAGEGRGCDLRRRRLIERGGDVPGDLTLLVLTQVPVDQERADALVSAELSHDVDAEAVRGGGVDGRRNDGVPQTAVYRPSAFGEVTGLV